jgi:multidrug efflux pump subunit AcrB
MMLSVLGETINIMTLGGLALAVGILVDDATVAIENINWHLEQGKDVETAILDGAQQIAVPALVATLCICIVFVPMFFLEGVSRYLFVPMAEAVVFAMLASYILSRTLVPTLAKYLLRPHTENDFANKNKWQRFQHRFEDRFETLRHGYRNVLERALHRRLSGLDRCVVAYSRTVARQRFFPRGGYRANQIAYARANRNAR